jgi:c-di-AMP phosphodiesterase-like protein
MAKECRATLLRNPGKVIGLGLIMALFSAHYGREAALMGLLVLAGFSSPGSWQFSGEAAPEKSSGHRPKKGIPCLGIVQVDNFEEVKQSTQKEMRPLLAVAIDQLLEEWAIQKKAYLQKYRSDRYLIFLDRQQLEACIGEKFPILDRVKEIQTKNKIPVTLSCGFGMGTEDFLELGQLAQAGLDLALGRGGDQVVIKDEEGFRFFGGKTKALEKRTKVKARVIAQALRKLIEQSRRVFLMGHAGADMDSMGSAIGMARGVECLGKKAYIVLEDVSPRIEKLVNFIEGQDDYENNILNAEEALRLIASTDLVLLLDTHRPSLVAVPELLEKTNKVVVIDHHRRGEEFIKDPILVYLEAYASSASELVTELLQYLGEEIDIKPWEATALLTGITVDTKNFSYQVGVRTFEAAAFLRRFGADPSTVQQILQADLDTFLARAEVVKKAEIFHRKVALGMVPGTGGRNQLLAAQAADVLLAIEGIEASFVLSEGEGEVYISARSSGDINVQVIMERLGGGGHMSMAGAQLGGVNLAEARRILLELMEEYFSGEVIK